MKTMKFKLFALVLTMISILATPLNTFAATSAVIETHSTSEYVYIDQDGNEYIFPTFEDYSIYCQAHRNKNLRYGESWVLQQTLASTTLKHKFIGYHSETPNWSKASQYVVGSGKIFNVSASYKWEDVSLNLGFSYSVSVATTIPANSSKYSRLGVAGDYTLKKERYAEYQYGVPTGVTRVMTYATKTANYIDVVYQ